MNAQSEKIEPEVEVDPVLDADKDLKLMTYFNELWEMDRDDFLSTETYKNTKDYYDRNSTYFTPLDRNEVKQPMIFKYLINHETVRPIVNLNRYPFFMDLFDYCSNCKLQINLPNVNNHFLFCFQEPKNQSNYLFYCHEKILNL